MALEHIHSILGIGNSYLVERNDHCILVDAGFPRDAKKIIKVIKKYEEKPLKYIIITHAHPDHLGSIKKIKTLYAVEVISHEKEKEYAEGKSYPKPKKFIAQVFAVVTKVLPKITIKIDHTVTDNETFEGFKVHHTPGHTPGSIILEDTSTEAIFTGDTIVTNRQGTKILKPSPIFSTNYGDVLNSAINSLSQIRPKHIFPGHGRPIINAETAVNRFLSKWSAKT